MRIPSRQSGSSLVEVLVTLVIVSIGLLGLAGLQLSSMQSANSASQRFTATTLGYDILERMRANRLQALNGDYDIDVGDLPGGAGVAGADLAAWKDALQALPGGDGSIAVDGRRVTITIEWQDAVRDGSPDPAPAVVRLRTEL